MGFRVVVKRLIAGKKLLISLGDSEKQLKTITLEQLKDRIYRTGCPQAGSRIIFAGKRLEDDRLLCDYGIQHMSLLHKLKRLVEGGGFPEKGDGGMGDKNKSQSMDRLATI